LHIPADSRLSTKLFGKSDSIGIWETFGFTYLGNNRIALKGNNGKFVSINKAAPYNLTVNADSITRATQFRIIIN